MNEDSQSVPIILPSCSDNNANPHGRTELSTPIPKPKPPPGPSPRLAKILYGDTIPGPPPPGSPPRLANKADTAMTKDNMLASPPPTTISAPRQPSLPLISSMKTPIHAVSPSEATPFLLQSHANSSAGLGILPIPPIYHPPFPNPSFSHPPWVSSIAHRPGFGAPVPSYPNNASGLHFPHHSGIPHQQKPGAGQNAQPPASVVVAEAPQVLSAAADPSGVTRLIPTSLRVKRPGQSTGVGSSIFSQQPKTSAKNKGTSSSVVSPDAYGQFLQNMKELGAIK